MQRILDITADTKSNWKLITNNFNKAYHGKVLDPDLIPCIAADYQDCQFNLFPNGQPRGWFPSFMPSKDCGSDVIGGPVTSIVVAWELNSGDYLGRENWQRFRIDI